MNVRRGRGGGPDGAAPPRIQQSWAPLDAALRAHAAGREEVILVVHTDVAEPESFPLSVLYRKPDALDAVDRMALERARGRVLDVGAGVGALAAPLHRAGFAVLALEVIPAALDALRARGLDIHDGPVDTLPEDARFDTILAVMNGTGLAGTRAALPAFLEALLVRLAPDGELLIDSTDPAAWGAPGDGRKPGEVHMQLEFDGVRGDPVPYLYVGPGGLAAAAGEAGGHASVILRDGPRYLASVRRP